MAVKTAQYIFNGQAYNLTYNSTPREMGSYGYSSK